MWRLTPANPNPLSRRNMAIHQDEDQIAAFVSINHHFKCNGPLAGEMVLISPMPLMAEYLWLKLISFPLARLDSLGQQEETHHET